LQISKRDILIHIKSFYLMKKTMCPCRNSFIPVNTPRHNGTKRRFTQLHHPYLNRRSMCTKRNIIPFFLFNKESVLHVTGRVLVRRVQGTEVMPIIFNLGTRSNDKTHLLENIDYFLADQK